MNRAVPRHEYQRAVACVHQAGCRYATFICVRGAVRFLPSFSIVFSPPLLYPLAVQEQEKQPRVMSSPTVVRALIWVSGLVQGVAYRAFTQRAASQQGLRGGVRNLDDGRVAVEVEGERQAVERLIASLRSGPPMARVQDVQVQWEAPTNQYDDFRIWY